VNLTLIRWGAIAIGVLFLALLVVGFIRDPFGWRKSRETAEKVATAEATAEVAQAAVRAVDTYHTQTVVIREKVEDGEAVVRELPDAETPLGEDRRAALCAGLERVRGEVVC
jgi:uncharacterized protein YpmB